jgi:hypothetical protein
VSSTPRSEVRGKGSHVPIHGDVTLVGDEAFTGGPVPRTLEARHLGTTLTHYPRTHAQPSPF